MPSLTSERVQELNKKIDCILGDEQSRGTIPLKGKPLVRAVLEAITPGIVELCDGVTIGKDAKLTLHFEADVISNEFVFWLNDRELEKISKFIDNTASKDVCEV
jgi:hypothetical protein